MCVSVAMETWARFAFPLLYKIKRIERSDAHNETERFLHVHIYYVRVCMVFFFVFSFNCKAIISIQSVQLNSHTIKAPADKVP